VRPRPAVVRVVKQHQVIGELLDVWELLHALGVVVRDPTERGKRASLTQSVSLAVFTEKDRPPGPGMEFLDVLDRSGPKQKSSPFDRMLKEKLVAEAPGILAWMIEGCLAWQQRGLDPPASVLNYTAEFFADHDTFGEWIEQNCNIDPKAKTSNEDLFTDWKMFCSNGYGDAGGRTEFIENLRKRGFVDTRINNSKRAMLGLKIKSTPLTVV
jgi:phage/plasmid-associated DNA primase